MNFLLKYKKIFLGIALIIISIAIGYLIYFLFFFSKITPPSNNNNNSEKQSGQLGFPESEKNNQKIEIATSTETGIPNSKNILDKDKNKNLPLPKTTDLNNVASLDVTLNQDGTGLKYYNQNDGKFYKIDQNGQIVALSNQMFPDVKNVNWQPQGSKAIIEYPDGSNVIYDFAQKKQKTIPKHWKDFNFSANGKNIVLKSIGLDPDNRWLVTADENGENTKVVEKLGKNEDIVYSQWSPNNKIIAMYTKGIDLNRQEVFFIGQNDENFKSMVVEGRDFRPKWSTTGDKLIYSVYSTNNESKPKLWVADANPGNIGEERKSLNVNTWSNKCTFANDQEIYCGVPKKLEKGAGMFPELADNTIDYLYKINIITKKKEKVRAFQGNYNISEIIISKDKKNIYFTDKLTQRIHKVNLE